MLLDTSGLLSYYNTNEPHHGDALRLFELQGPKLIHSYIVAEFVALANARRLPREGSLRFIGTVLAHPEIETVWVDEAVTREALALLEKRMDKGYSLCDAVSFVLMKAHGMHEALTTDHHFEQEGFTRLLVR
jgi:predicted nucleic acid-binding protein